MLGEIIFAIILLLGACGIIAFFLFATGEILDILYWLWAIFEDKIIGKKKPPRKKQDYSIDQGKPAT